MIINFKISELRGYYFRNAMENHTPSIMTLKEQSAVAMARIDTYVKVQEQNSGWKVMEYQSHHTKEILLWNHDISYS